MLQAVFQEEIERCASNAGSALSLSPNYLSTLAAACRENAVAELLARLLEATFQLIEVSHIPPFWARIESLDSDAPAQLVEVLALAANIVEACKWLVVATREYLRAQPVAYSPSEKALLLSLERRFSVHVAAVMYDTAPSKFPGEELIMKSCSTSFWTCSSLSMRLCYIPTIIFPIPFGRYAHAILSSSLAQYQFYVWSSCP